MRGFIPRTEFFPSGDQFFVQLLDNCKDPDREASQLQRFMWKAQARQGELDCRSVCIDDQGAIISYPRPLLVRFGREFVDSVFGACAT